MPRLLIASYHFPPASAVGGRRPARLARLLPELGYECDVICASPENASEGSDASLLSLVPEGLNIRRIDTPFVFGRNPAHSPPTGPMQRVWWKARTYAEWIFVAHDWSWNWGVAAAKALSAAPDSEQEYDALVLDAPPRPAVVPFVRWAKRRGVPILLDLRDIWAWDSESMPGPLDLRPASRRLRWELPLRAEAITGAEHVVVTSPALATLMRGRFPDLPATHFSCIPNAFQDVDSTPAGSGEQTRGRLRVAYTGSLAYGRLDQTAGLIRGMAEAKRRGGPDVELVVAGAGGDSLLDTALAEGLEGNVTVLGQVSRDESVRIQREADALLLLQPRQMGAREAIPAKLFEYMERRRNVLGLVGASPGARIIEENGLGVVSLQEDPRSIAESLTALARCVADRPFLPPPPDAYSERATVTEFAERLDRILATSAGPG